MRVQLAALIACGALSQYRVMLGAALPLEASLPRTDARRPLAACPAASSRAGPGDLRDAQNQTICVGPP